MNSKAPEGGKAANGCPPVAPTTEGASIDLKPNAPDDYNATGAAGKGNFAMPKKSAGRPDSLPAISPRSGGTPTSFRAPDGRIWAYRHKRGKVLQMLATWCQGVTQCDTLPWHTRLAATVDVMRDDGLLIDTVIEGDNRHARYFLRTPGTLLPKGELQ